MDHVVIGLPMIAVVPSGAGIREAFPFPWSMGENMPLPEILLPGGRTRTRRPRPFHIRSPPEACKLGPAPFMRQLPPYPCRIRLNSSSRLVSGALFFSLRFSVFVLFSLF